MIIIGNDISRISEFKSCLSKYFEKKNMFSVISWDSKTHQMMTGIVSLRLNITSDLLSHVGLSDSVTVSTLIKSIARFTTLYGRPI